MHSGQRGPGWLNTKVSVADSVELPEAEVKVGGGQANPALFTHRTVNNQEKKKKKNPAKFIEGFSAWPRTDAGRHFHL